jgi:hypothetical protein
METLPEKITLENWMAALEIYERCKREEIKKACMGFAAL